MDRLYSFTFDSRTWSTKQCRNMLEPWTFGHAVRRKRSLFAFGSAQGEFGSLEVRVLARNNSVQMPEKPCTNSVGYTLV